MGYTPPFFNVRNIAGGVSIYPNGVTTDDLKIYPNPVDTTTYLELDGTGQMKLYSASSIALIPTTTLLIYGNKTINFTGDLTIECLSGDGNIYLKPEGTGLVKFGTHTGTGDVACNGYIPIKDAAGNARKLMTTA
jgi:hypothetical protein